MNTINPPPNWNILGELNLSAGANTDAAIHAWLVEILASLNLSPDFLARVLRAAQESAGHTSQPDGAGRLPYIHISILVPFDHTPAGKSWGFFNIEKIETSADGGDERYHAIDFYLYGEGD